jgi:hypothetical protein
MENIKADHYFYLHNNSQKVLQDILNLRQQPYYLNRQNKEGYFKRGNDIYINTWYCSYNNQYLSNSEMTIFVLINIFKRTLKELFNHDMLDDPLYFLPKIDYTKYNVTKVNNLITTDTRKKVLVCNNTVDSGQSENFDFDDIIKIISNEFPDTLFIVTNMKNPINKFNVMYCKDIIPYSNNLNEISYLSKFCSVIIGRLSGPQTFSSVQDNLLDPKKKIITFIRKEINGYFFGDGSFGVTSILPEGERASYIHSNNFEPNNILEVIRKELT